MNLFKSKGHGPQAVTYALAVALLGCFWIAPLFGQELMALDARRPFLFSQQGKTLVANPGHGAIGLWDPATGQQLAKFENPGHGPTHLGIRSCFASTSSTASGGRSNRGDQSWHWTSTSAH